VQQLGKDAMVLGDAKAEMRLTASCGSASTTEPGEDVAALIDRSDQAQAQAKVVSKKHTPRVSAWVVGSGEVQTYAPGA
jgi:PleD family two-component response regulator